jgi:hypothetical protein
LYEPAWYLEMVNKWVMSERLPFELVQNICFYGRSSGSKGGLLTRANGLLLPFAVSFVRSSPCATNPASHSRLPGLRC